MTARGVEGLLDRLQEDGYLVPRVLENGGMVLDVTEAGRAAIEDPVLLDRLVAPPRPRSRSTQARDREKEPQPEPDAALLERLSFWRKEQASLEGIPPYWILTSKALRSIAVQRPVIKEALLAIKGVGRKKLDKYGDPILALVQAHLREKT